ncbi:MAG: helix-turn-helix domain-containing protein, partial [Sphingobacteriaceae bacterium]
LMDNVCCSADFLIPMLGNIVCLTNFAKVYSAEQIRSALTRLDTELFANGTGKAVMLQACLQEFFIMLFRLWESEKNTGTQQDPVILGYFEKFQRVMRQFNAGQTVKALAAEIGISHVHLNRICNQITGQSAGQLLDERLLEESKKYLSYTSYSVSEIAYQLKFEYPNYFARFFRKRTGLSPLKFRKQLNS